MVQVMEESLSNIDVSKCVSLVSFFHPFRNEGKEGFEEEKEVMSHQEDSCFLIKQKQRTLEKEMERKTNTDDEKEVLPWLHKCMKLIVKQEFAQKLTYTQNPP